MKKVQIYTDGACSGNPGDGGWGAVLIFGEHEKEFSGFVKNTTNNQMEMMAAIAALGKLKEPCEVELFSDSAYLINGFNQGWIFGWRKNGWKTSNKEEVKNKELWMALDQFTKVHKITFIKVKGHSDNVYNNRCDELATGAIKKNKN